MFLTGYRYPFQCMGYRESRGLLHGTMQERGGGGGLMVVPS